MRWWEGIDTVRKSAGITSKLLARWYALRSLLQRGDPRRFFVGRLSYENTKIIQTARNSPRRRQKVSRRPRVLVARKRRIAQATVFAIKLTLSSAALTGLTMHVLGYLSTSPRFAIAHIGVHGNTRVTSDAIIEQSGIVEGESIFRVSLADAAAAIEKIPQIRRAWVQKKMPDEVYIEVTERTPVALVLSRELLCIDEDAKLFARVDSAEGIDGPIITGKSLAGLTLGDTAKVEGISEALELVRLMDRAKTAQSIRISEINIDVPSNIVLVAEPLGATILLGTGDLEGKLWRLTKVVDEIRRDKRFQMVNLEKMDMRFEGIVPAKFKDS